MDYWTPEEIRKLEDSYPNRSNEDLVKLLNKTEVAIVSKAQRMKLKKHWMFRQKILKEAKIGAR